MRWAGFISIWLLAAGCSHYGWADRDAVQTPCGVHTIGVPPESRVDEAALTETMVSELRTRGVGAHWGSSDQHQIRCQVQFDDFFAGASEFVSKATLDCLVDETRVSRSATSRATLTGRDSTRARETIRLDAAIDAVNLALPAIVTTLRSDSE